MQARYEKKCATSAPSSKNTIARSLNLAAALACIAEDDEGGGRVGGGRSQGRGEEGDDDDGVCAPSQIGRAHV